jgi:hypothetical protein
MIMANDWYKQMELLPLEVKEESVKEARAKAKQKGSRAPAPGARPAAGSNPGGGKY